MSRTIFTIIGLGLAGALSCLSGCSSTSSTTNLSWDPDGAPRHGGTYENGGRYQFAYFPSTKTYFEPHTQTYIWNECGTWMTGSQLPPHFIVHSTDATIVERSSRIPPVAGVSGHAYACMFDRDITPESRSPVASHWSDSEIDEVSQTEMDDFDASTFEIESPESTEP